VSKPGIIYRIQQQYFHENTDVQTIVDISDTDNLIDDSDDPEIRELVSSGNPLDLSVIDNEEDPLTPVKATQAICRFNSDSTYSMSTFLGGSDFRWLVHAYIGTDDKTVFKGFLVKSQLRESFMPVPNIVELLATDGIGILKDIPLQNAAGENPRGVFKIMDLIAMIMAKTGLSLEFRVAFNIKLNGMVDDISIANANDEHLFSNGYIDVKTLEKEIGLSEDCYTALKKFLGEEGFITQRQGMWWILRVDEIEDPTRGLYITSFDSDGQFVANLGEKTFRKDIVRSTLNNTIQVINAATEVMASDQHKSVRLNYDYNTPIEIVANIDMNRGTLVQDLGTEKHYRPESWQPCRNTVGGNDVATGNIYVKKIFDAQGNITEKYLVLEADSNFNLVISEPTYMHQKDIFVLSLERRLNADVAGSGHYRDEHVQVRLYGIDGTFWTHEGRSTVNDVAQWVACTSTFSTNQKYFPIEGDASEDQRDSKNLYDGKCAPLPVDGYIRILLYQSAANGASQDTYFSNIKLEYQPYVGGSYLQYTGQYHTTHQDGNFRTKREVDVFMSDSFKRLFKGALLRLDSWATVYSGAVDFLSVNSFSMAGFKILDYQIGQIVRFSGSTSNNITSRVTAITYHVLTTSTEITIEDATTTETAGAVVVESPVFVLAREFYNAAVFPAGPPSSDYVHTYGEIQLFDVWNQFKNVMRVFQLVAQGCDLEKLDTDSNVDHVHVVHKWSISDPSPHTYHRYFLLMHFRQNWRTAEWSGTMREVFNLDVAKDYSNHLFVLKPTNG
jgi:hypothetical protein